jgi:pentatricopeptide repeat protein
MLKIAIFLVLMVGLPDRLTSLDHFEWHRRAIWALIAGSLLVFRGWKLPPSLARGPGILALALIVWMILVSLLGHPFWRETEVLGCWLLPLLLFLAGLSVETSEWRAVKWALAAAAMAQAVLMLLQRWGLDPVYGGTTASMAYAPGRMIGTIGYQNQAVDAVLLSGTPWLGMGPLAGMLFAAGSSVLAALAGYRSGVVAIVLATAAAGGWWYVSRKRLAGWNWRVAAGVGATVLIVGAGLCVAPEWRARISELRQGTHEAGVASRLKMARVAIAMIKERPWTGWGGGEYAYQYLPRLARIQPADKTHNVLRGTVFAREAHCDALQLTAEFGVVGLALALALAAALLRLAWKGRRDAPVASRTVVFLMAYLSVVGLFSFPWHYAIAGPLAGFLLGACMAKLTRQTMTESHALAPVRYNSAFSLAGAALCIGLFVLFGWNTVLAENQGRGTLPPWAARYRALAGARLVEDGRPEALQRARQELETAHFYFQDILLYNNLGNVYSRQGEWELARSVYQEWSESGIDHHSALLNLSIALEQLGRYKEAADILERSRTLFPDSSVGLMKRLATLYFLAGNDEKARRFIERWRLQLAVKGAALPAEFENLAGAIELRQGTSEKARSFFLRALDRDPNLKSAQMNLERVNHTGIPPLK